MISEFSHKRRQSLDLASLRVKDAACTVSGSESVHAPSPFGIEENLLFSRNPFHEESSYDNKLLPTVSTQPIRHSRSDSSNSSQYTMPKVSFFTSYLDRLHLRGCEWVAMPCSSCS